ncbi:bifunctional 5,10-methylenetetrahydrofolate dehydrogenase/5,10-methenyltetrahydrofolate cyclohydrolase [Candidatus Bandiella numerosa]|uniref:bifunctional 5,10-methylenetetrahydrofolate dehydrogenase/5,10-methenyltetrahydrofolate cyclohydrolase n=1 Tax=Candidatus Bandiella numerosa TaxID=2570586 RepID=UPI00249F1F05|nr:bifunctional 5,10-methylenetetrahydrofolate dehydrogenase/5,10-methenyltetrahydrofolate cyclohydrolase [Candidatus Bandiella numerosa]WHA05155.1 bifunctional 5,10-methylenetetrahydrofolate dehydrogenase/5,10-methenyltetrahydrofolate cyclohydrolase [Candidatus Bandiella numerosa]
MTYIINGKLIAEELLSSIKKEVKDKFEIIKMRPKIATVLIGNNSASKVYVNAKLKAAENVGINTELLTFNEDINNKKLSEIITTLNERSDITGILVQLPLPKHLDEQIVFETINYKKDVDAFGIYNIGLLNHWKSQIMPCTPQGILFILKKYLKDLSGKKVVIIGRSIIVGRPLASILIRENCTVTVVHSKTINIKEECSLADILIVATGVPNLIKADWVKKNSFVIDVGISRVNNKIVGDVDFENVKNFTSFITPVPGGIGPLTVANLLLNTLKLFLIQNNLSSDVAFIKNHN